jgi:hypothetical protein
VIVDKDRQPCWNPGRIEQVTEKMVEPFFTATGDGLHLAVAKEPRRDTKRAATTC